MIKKEIVIAATAVIAVVMLFFGMQFLKGLELFSNDVTYKMKFADISGLTASSPIYTNGYRVGTVKHIDYDYNHPNDINVIVGIDKNLPIPEGTRAEITSDFLGNVQVSLLLGSPTDKLLAEGGLITGVINDGTMGEVKNMIPTVQKMLPKLDSIMASLNQILADPAIMASLHHVNQITSDLTVSTRQLNALLAQVNGQMPGMLRKTNDVLTHADGAVVTANNMMGTLNRQMEGVDIQATMAQVNQTLANVQQLTDKLNSKQGTMGLLMNDRTLYNNLSGAAESMDSLLTNLKAHPKRYVHFSVFGKKE